MSLKLTPEMLRAAYDMLAETAPFNRWNLPTSDDLTFKVGRTKHLYGWCDSNGKDRTIVVSAGKVGHLLTLLATLSHEMIHLHQDRLGLPLDHGPAFQKWASLVCRHHRDFDPKNFV